MKSNRNHSLLRNSSLKQKTISIENQNEEVPKEEELYNFSSKSKNYSSYEVGTSKRSNKLQLDEFHDYNDIHDTHEECNQVLSSASIMMQNAQMLSDFVQKIKQQNQNQVSDFNTQQSNINLPPSQYQSQNSCGFKTQRESNPDSQLTLPSNLLLKWDDVGLQNAGNESRGLGKTKVVNLKQNEMKEESYGKKQSKSQLNQPRHVKSSSHFINQALNKEYLKFRMRQCMIKNQLMKYVNHEQLEAQTSNPKKQAKLHIPSLNESKSCNQLPIDQSFINQQHIIQQYAQQQLTDDLSREIYRKELQLTNENIGVRMKRKNEQLKQSASKTKIHKGTSIASQMQKSEYGGSSTERGSLLQVCGNNQFQNCLGLQNSERIFVQESQQVIHQKIKETAPFNPNLCKSQLALGFKKQISAKKLYRMVRDSQDQHQKSIIREDEQTIDDLLAVGQKVDQNLLNKISAIGERKLPRLSCKQNVNQNIQTKDIQNVDYQMKDSFLIQSSIPVKEKVVSQVRESQVQVYQKSNSREKSRGGGRPFVKQTMNMSKSQVHKQNTDQIKDNMIAQCNKDLEFIRVEDRSCNVSPKQPPCKPHFKLLKQKFDENQRGNKTQRQTKTYIIRSSSKKVETLKNAIDAYRDVMMIDEDHMMKHSNILKPSKVSYDQVQEGDEDDEGMWNDQQKLINKRKTSQSFRQSLSFRETLQNMLVKKHMDIVKSKEGEINADLE